MGVKKDGLPREWDVTNPHKVQFAMVRDLSWTPSESDVLLGLDSVYESIRVALVRRSDYALTPLIVDKMLKDSTPVMTTLLRRFDWTPSRDNVMDGLSSSYHSVRRTWIMRRDWTPDEEMVDKVLSDLNYSNKVEWLKRLDWKPLERHVEILLSDNSRDVVIGLIRRMDWTPTDDQITSGMSSTDESIASAWKDRIKSITESTLRADGEQNEQGYSL